MHEDILQTWQDLLCELFAQLHSPPDFVHLPHNLSIYLYACIDRDTYLNTHLAVSALVMNTHLAVSALVSWLPSSTAKRSMHIFLYMYIYNIYVCRHRYRPSF